MRFVLPSCFFGISLIHFALASLFSTDTNACIEKKAKSCSECMEVAGCGWCEYPLYANNPNIIKSRCDLPKNLLAGACPAEAIVNPSSDVDDVKNDPHSSVGESDIGKATQLRLLLRSVRYCFYQYVKKGCALSVFYQSMSYEPVTIYVANDQGEILHENELRKGGYFTCTSKTGGSHKICMENYSWGAKRIFLSIRVESHRNSQIMLSEDHPMALEHLQNIEVSARSMEAHLWHRRAELTSKNVLATEDQSFIIWFTWVLFVVALMTYILQIIEIHRIFEEAESKKTFSMEGGLLRIGMLRS